MACTGEPSFRSFLGTSVESVAEATVLHVEGEIDIATAPTLSSALANARCTNGPVIVDLRRADYLDGAGIHVLERDAERNQGQLVVVGSKPHIQRLFDLLGLTKVLPVMVSIDAALDYLRTAVMSLQQQDRYQLTHPRT